MSPAATANSAKARPSTQCGELWTSRDATELDTTRRNATRRDITQLDADRRDAIACRLAPDTDFGSTRPDWAKLPTRPGLEDATTPLDTEGNSHPGMRDAPGRDATDATGATTDWDADATNATDGTERGDLTDATERDALELDTLAINAETHFPVEPTPAVRKQLEPMICLGDLLETVASEISLTHQLPSLLPGSPKFCSTRVPRTREIK